MRQFQYILLSSILFTIIGCTKVSIKESDLKHLHELKEDTMKGKDQFEISFRQFIRIVDESLELRRDAKIFFKELNRKLSNDIHLTSEDQQKMQDDLTLYRNNHSSLEIVVEKFNSYNHRNITIVFPSSRASEIVENVNSSGEIINVEIYINPNDEIGRLAILEIKMWLSSKLITMDNYVVILVRYLKKSEFRRQFNMENIDLEGKIFLEEISEEITDGEKYNRTVKSIKLVKKIFEYERNHPSSIFANNKENLYLNALIEGSYAFHRIPELSYFDELEIEIDVTENAFYNDISSLSSSATNSLSNLFGNTIGLYEERKGKLNDMPMVEQRMITQEMQLLDILFEKTPFRLTDHFIPGHYGHVAMWVGGKNDIPELIRLGVWQELPRIEKEARLNFNYIGLSFQELIEQNHSILEALRQGVEVNPFENFLNIDDLAVIRNETLSDKQKKDYLLRAFAQIGKEYDFNFDIETNETIVCSELIFTVYDDFKWPVEKSLGRYSISPDDIAALAIKEGDPFLPVLIYHDGKKLPKHLNYKNFKSLHEGNYSGIEVEKAQPE